MKVSDAFLIRTRFRDKLIFAVYSLAITLFFQVGIVGKLLPDYSTLTFSTLLVVLFYFSAFMAIPLQSIAWRIALLIPIFGFSFFLLRELAHALLPLSVRAKPFFELSLVLVFILSLVGRNIRIYISLIQNLERLNALRLHNQLFSQRETVELNFGHEGKLKIHPNEIVYIRTKTSGDHTKVFGLKQKKDKIGQKKLVEYETTAYKNFNEIFAFLSAYPQFKRISQSTVFNFQYPYEEKKGVILIESRRFAINSKYKKPTKQD